MSDAPAVLLLHGFTGSGAGWQPVISGLGERYRAIAPDIRGHASAADRQPVTLAAVLDDLADAIDAAGVGSRDPLIIVGYSQGGRLALHAALDPRLARRLQRLVLIGASPGLATAEERRARRAADERLAAEFQQLTIEQIAERWARTPILGGIAAQQAAQAGSERRRSTPAGLAAALRGLGTGALPSLWERLEEINVPVRMIVGERDPKFRAIAEQMRERLPDSTVTVVPGAGHAVQLEQPQVVSRIVRGG